MKVRENRISQEVHPKLYMINLDSCWWQFDVRLKWACEYMGRTLRESTGMWVQSRWSRVANFSKALALTYYFSTLLYANQSGINIYHFRFVHVDCSEKELLPFSVKMAPDHITSLIGKFRAQSSEWNISGSTGRTTMILGALESSRRVYVPPALKFSNWLSFDSIKKWGSQRYRIWIYETMAR